MLFIKSIMEKYFNGYTLFSSVLLFHLIWIFQGLDVTDLGSHLTNQACSFSGHVTVGVAPMVFLTDFFGGMWLNIAGNPNILWARFGGTLLFSLNTLISYKILSCYFDRQKTFFIVFAATLFITMRTSALIHYYNFPALLLNLELLIFNQLLNSPLEKTAFKVYSFLLGFMAISIILARFPLILIVFIPVILLSHYVITKDDITELKRSAPYVISGVFAAVILFMLFYSSIGFLHSYIEAISARLFNSIIGNAEEVSQRFSMLTMLKHYLREYLFEVINYTAIALIGLYFISFLKDRINNKIANLALVAILLIGFILFVVFNFGVNVYVYALIRLSIGLILFVSYIFFMHDRGRCKNLSLLLLVSGFVMLISPIGSTGGVLKSKDGMWLILPLVLLLTYELRETIDNKRLRAMVSFNTAIILLLVVLSLFFHFTNICRDDPNRFNLNAVFKYKHLRHVYSQKSRVDVLDEALMQIDKLTEKNDTVLMINGIPLFYYLTQTRPFFGPAWLFVDRPCSKIERMYEMAIDSKRYPKLFVYSKVDTRSPGWPDDTIGRLTTKDLPKLEYLKDKYINDLTYVLVWENAAFAIYAVDSDERVSERTD